MKKTGARKALALAAAGTKVQSNGGGQSQDGRRREAARLHKRSAEDGRAPRRTPAGLVLDGPGVSPRRKNKKERPRRRFADGGVHDCATPEAQRKGAGREHCSSRSSDRSAAEPASTRPRRAVAPYKAINNWITVRTSIASEMGSTANVFMGHLMGRRETETTQSSPASGRLKPDEGPQHRTEKQKRRHDRTQFHEDHARLLQTGTC